MAGNPIKRERKAACAALGVPYVDSRTPKERAKHYYKLSEKDHEIILKGIREYVPTFMIAAKIGCGASTLTAYINRTPALLEAKQDADKGKEQVAESLLWQSARKGEFRAAQFILERRYGWINKQQQEIIGAIPCITIGEIPEAELPTDIGQPELIASASTDDVPPPAEDTKLPDKVVLGRIVDGESATDAAEDVQSGEEDDVARDDSGWFDADDNSTDDGWGF